MGPNSQNSALLLESSQVFPCPLAFPPHGKTRLGPPGEEGRKATWSQVLRNYSHSTGKRASQGVSASPNAHGQDCHGGQGQTLGSLTRFHPHRPLCVGTGPPPTFLGLRNPPAGRSHILGRRSGEAGRPSGHTHPPLCGFCQPVRNPPFQGGPDTAERNANETKISKIKWYITFLFFYFF